VPGARAETNPESVTLAIVALEVNQATGRPGRGAPLASLGIATARTVCPVVSETGMVSDTDATRVAGFSTATTDVPYEPHAATPIAVAITASMKVRDDMRPPL
jgi:hypothetical protein